MADYIAYVAKDLCNQRACHILECPKGRASEVINSIGRAFETRFRQLLSLPAQPLPTTLRSSVKIMGPEETSVTEQKPKQQDGEVFQGRDYYNMIPGKMPTPVGEDGLQITEEEKKQATNINAVCLSRPVSLYENCSVTEETPAPSADSDEISTSADSNLSSSLPETLISDLIHEEGWYHGRLSREEAESLLTCSGDFLVRESSSASGQYVLSGMEGVTVRHLLLVDPHGQVRTRDQVFLSVGHLVRFHMENQTPIISGSSELCLRQPVLQRH